MSIANRRWALASVLWPIAYGFYVHVFAPYGTMWNTPSIVSAFENYGGEVLTIMVLPLFGWAVFTVWPRATSPSPSDPPAR